MKKIYQISLLINKRVCFATGRATGYALDGPGSIPGNGQNFSLLHSAHTHSEAHSASNPTDTGAFPLEMG
jgi:hypothetical protein